MNFYLFGFSFAQSHERVPDPDFHGISQGGHTNHLDFGVGHESHVQQPLAHSPPGVMPSYPASAAASHGAQRVVAGSTGFLPRSGGGLTAGLFSLSFPFPCHCADSLVVVNILPVPLHKGTGHGKTKKAQLDASPRLTVTPSLLPRLVRPKAVRGPL